MLILLGKALFCERLKCKESLIWPAFLLIPFIPIFMGAGNYLNNLSILQSEWYSYWTQATLFYTTFFFAPLIGVYCAFLWRYENFNRCRNLLFTHPVPYPVIYLSKLLLVCLLSLMTQAWFALLFFLSGKLIGLEGLPPTDICIWILRGTLGAMVIASLQFFIASETASFATPIALGLIGGITGLLAANSSLGIFWPYAQMLLGMNSNKSEDILGQKDILFLLLTVFYSIGIYLVAVHREGKNG